jgi:hypothetical protein
MLHAKAALNTITLMVADAVHGRIEKEKPTNTNALNNLSLRGKAKGGPGFS